MDDVLDIRALFEGGNNKIDSEEEPDLENEEYGKEDSPGGGVEYEIRLITLFALEGLKCYEHCNWKISTQTSDAGKLNDLVWQSSIGNIYVQAKTRKNRCVYERDFLSDVPTQLDFNIASYIISYKYETKLHNIKYLLLCTDCTIKSPLLEEQTDRHDMLRAIFSGARMCTIKSNSRTVREIKKYIDYFKKELLPKHKKQHWKQQKVTKRDISTFISKFIWVRINKHDIKTLIEKRTECFDNVTVDYLIDQIRNWHAKNKSKLVYLKNLYTKSILYGETSRTCTEKYLDALLTFRGTYTIEKNKMLFITPGSRPNLNLNKIVQQLRIHKQIPHDMILFLEKDIYQHLSYFKLNKFKYLVVSLLDCDDEETKSICEMLECILKLKKEKSVFLIGNGTSYNNAKFITKLGDPITFDSFASTAQDMLMKTQVSFQGEGILLKKLFDWRKTHLIDEHVITKLRHKDGFSIGKKIKSLDTVEQYHVTRTIRNENKIIANHEDLDRVVEKLIILTGPPGAGKSIYLINLANFRKTISPLTWIIHLDMTKVVNYLEQNCKELLQISDLHSLLYRFEGAETKFEEELMDSSEKYLIIDSIAETNEKHIEQLRRILNFTLNNGDVSKFLKVIIGVRDKNFHLRVLNRNDVSHVVFEIDMFQPEDQETFFEKYKSHKDKRIQADYTEFIEVFKQVNDFMSNPLYLRLLSEIFLETGRRSELASTSEKVNRYKLYKYFFDIKKTIFLEELTTRNCNLWNILADTFDRYLNDLSLTAIRSVFSNIEYDLLFNGNSVHDFVFDIGILEKTDNEYSFTHATFEEFFAAEYIWSLLLKSNPNVLVYLLDTVFLNSRHLGVCCILEDVVDHINVPNDFKAKITDAYRSIIHNKIRLKQNMDMSHLARHGLTNVTKLFLEKCGNCSEILNGVDSDGKTAFLLSYRYPQLTKLLADKGTNVNAVDKNGHGIFQYLVNRFLTSEEKCQESKNILEIIRYLTKNKDFGFKLDAVDKAGNTLLHWASMNDGLNEVLNYLLIECKVSILSNSDGNTPLHYAAYYGAVGILRYFVEQRTVDILDVKNNNNDTLVHSATSGNSVNALKYLIETHNLRDVDENNDGNTPLIHAYLNKKAEALEYLKTVNKNHEAVVS